MRNEKIFNAMEHLEDRFIAEAMEKYDSAEDIDLVAEDPVDPYAEGTVFTMENGGGKRKIGFAKWAGLAAGVCAVTAGVAFVGGSGVFHSNTAASFDYKPTVCSFDYLEETYDLEYIDIDDPLLIQQISNNTALIDGNKIYYSRALKEEEKAVIYAYDIEEKTSETLLEIEDKYPEYRGIHIYCVNNGYLCYQDWDCNYYDDKQHSSERTSICCLDINAKTSREIYSTPIEKRYSKEIFVGKSSFYYVQTSGKYLFFNENIVTVHNKYNTKDCTNINRYDMESGEYIVFKENAEIIALHRDKLIFHSTSLKGGIYSCDITSGENEENLQTVGEVLYLNNLFYDGENLWVAEDYVGGNSSWYDNPKSFGCKAQRLNENLELEPVNAIYDINAPELYALNDWIISERIIFDTKSGECIMTESDTFLYVMNGELYCINESESEKKLYRFNIGSSENSSDNRPEEIEYPEYDIDTLREIFDVEELEIDDNVNHHTMAVQGNKIYYINGLSEENKFRICVYDAENKTTDVVYEEYEANLSLRWARPLLVYENSLYYQDFIHIDPDEGGGCLFHLSRLDLNTGKSEVIYKLSGFPATERVGMIVKASGKYLFFEDLGSSTESSWTFDTVRYNIESGEAKIFKEDAAMPTPHKDKLYFYRSFSGATGALYRCDIESGENEEKLCDLLLNYTSDLICSDGEKIWITPTVLKTFETSHTLAYLDEENKAVSVYSLNRYGLYDIVYANGYILADDRLINAKTNEIFEVKGRAFALNGQLFYTERSNEEESEYKIYRLNAKQ